MCLSYMLSIGVSVGHRDHTVWDKVGQCQESTVAGVSKHTSPKSHWLPALHALARTRPQSIPTNVKSTVKMPNPTI
eukprot:4944166-Amphidinium_carterae.1